MIKKSSIALGILLLLIASMSDVLAENIDLFVGEVKVLGKIDVDRVAIGKDGLVKFEILSTGELIIIGENAGSTSVRLWNKDNTQTQYNIRVSKDDPEKRVRMDTMIRVTVKMVEFRKSALSKLGIEWGKDMSGPTFATAGDFISNSIYRPANSTIDGASLPQRVKPFASYFGFASTLTSRINLLASDGDAIVISEPVLSCVNGGTAKFISGGEYPIPITNEKGGTSVTFKQYGIKMDISPRANNKNQIHTKIKTEVSEIDKSTYVLGVPGILKNETETIINVESGETIVISGLLKSKLGEGNSKVPGLGDLPLIGGLFGTTDLQTEMSEMVVFITPEVVEVKDTHDERSERLMNYRNTRTEQIKEGLEYNILD